MSADGRHRAPRFELRAFGLVTLGAIGILLPVEAHYRSPETLQPLLLVYGIHLALATLILLASHAESTFRGAAWTARLLVFGHVAALHLYLYCAPREPGLVANALTCLLLASAILFSWSTTRALTIAVLACVSFAVVGVLASADAMGPFVLAQAGLLVGAVIVVSVAHLFSRFRGNLAERQEELRALSANLVSVQEQERRRLSRELHDELGQSLTAVSSYLWLIERQLPDGLDELRNRAAEARRLVAKTLGEMRELSQLLCPPVLELYGLVSSLDVHLKAFADRQELQASFSAAGIPDRLPAEIETALYRITQEALTNVARHARARAVRVALAAERGGIRLQVSDDGVGLPAGSARARHGGGLLGIAERVRTLGGTFSVNGGSGTRLLVWLPYRPARGEEAPVQRSGATDVGEALAAAS